ncbi:hypothetical protein BDV18DRAFT_160165 [Aspergillus unguis]
MSDFSLARKLPHLVVQPSDAALDPPEGYLFVQDGLIIACGVLYALMSLTLAYEIYFAFTTTSTTLERICFLVWFELDLLFVSIIIRRIYPRGQWRRLVGEMALYTILAVLGLRYLSLLYPDDRDQVTAYWTGILLQLPVGWVYAYRLLADRSVLGHSMEMWVVRYIGCYTAYGVFAWRYLNVPQNWEYVGSFWSIAIIVATLLPETVYPFLYLRVWSQSKEKAKAA